VVEEVDHQKRERERDRVETHPCSIIERVSELLHLLGQVQNDLFSQVSITPAPPIFLSKEFLVVCVLFRDILAVVLERHALTRVVNGVNLGDLAHETTKVEVEQLELVVGRFVKDGDCLVRGCRLRDQSHHLSLLLRAHQIPFKDPPGWAFDRGDALQKACPK